MPERHPRNTPRWLELTLVWHLGAMSVFCAWAFGGQAPWVRDALLGLGAVGIVLFFLAAWTRELGPWRTVKLVWPLLVFDLISAVACFNPSFRSSIAEGVRYHVMVEPLAWLPSSAQPGLAIRELLLLNGLVFSCHNLFAVFSRTLIRRLLFVTAGNAVMIAIFGTFQKLMNAPGLWFGAVKSPNEFFFGTFIYHNHWGAFVVLNLAICAGLFFHSLRRSRHRDLWHSPLLAGAVAALAMAVTAPMSGSRSSSLLICLLLLGAAAHFAATIIRQRSARHESAVVPVVAISLLVVLGASAAYFLGRPMIERRLQTTATQLSEIRSQTDVNSRIALYRDTLTMARERIWFGWGLESYAHVFQVYNTQRPVESVFRTKFFAEAHSDWLQLLAENGIIGTALVLLLGLLPLLTVNWWKTNSALPRYLLVGCSLILVYAWIEFPFANPSVILAFWTALFAGVRYGQLESAAAHGNRR